MKNKIWIVSEYYYPVYQSTGYYMTEIAEHLARNRDNVNVICTNAGYNTEIFVSTEKCEKWNNVTIRRVSTYKKDKSHFYNRLISSFLASSKLFFKIWNIVKVGDEILIVTNPAFLLLVMPLLKKFKGVRYKVLVHDIFPENLIAIGRINQKAIVTRLLKKFFDLAYSRADTCIAIGRDMWEVLKLKVGGGGNVTLITNWSEVDLINPIERNLTSVVNDLHLQDKFIFQFAGNLGMLQGIENLLESIRLVSNEHIHFIFIGSGTQENLIKGFIADNDLKNVSLLGYRRREEQSDFLSACDVSLVTLSAGMFGLGVPSKAYNIMAAGKPILVVADENSEISLCVKENDIGWVVPPNEPVKLALKIEEIYYFIVNNGLRINNPREVAKKKYAKEIILSKFDNLYS